MGRDVARRRRRRRHAAKLEQHELTILERAEHLVVGRRIRRHELQLPGLPDVRRRNDRAVEIPENPVDFGLLRGDARHGGGQ